jgi:hypothetical protein
MKKLDRREFLSASAALGSFAVIASEAEKTASANRYEKF